MKRKILSAAIAVLMCAGTLLPLTAGADERGIEEATGKRIVYLVTDVFTAPSTGYSNARMYELHNQLYGGSVSIVDDPELCAMETFFSGNTLTTHYDPDAKPVEVGDLLVMDGIYEKTDAYSNLINDNDEAAAALGYGPLVIRNMGSCEDYLDACELTLTDRTTEGSKVFTFRGDGGTVYTYDAKALSFGYSMEELDAAQVGATVKAVLYKDMAVPYQVLTDAPLPEGDPDGDGAVNAKDASAVLMTAAQIGAKRKPTLSLAQRNACDVNKDGAVNAKDASYILRYAAYIGAKNPYVSISEFLN